MWLKKIFMLYALLILTSEFARSQQTHAKKDSSKLYKQIESFSTKSKLSRYLYPLVFKPVKTNVEKKKKKKKLVQNPYSAFEGKIIRHIKITTLEPFKNTIADTIMSRQTLLSRTGNFLHIKSKSITIRNLLLFHKNEPFDSLIIIESERLVRSRAYVQDVSFFVAAVSKNSDSVDIFIRELDTWSIMPEVAASPSSFNIKLTDNNFLGLGHQLSNSYAYNHTKGEYVNNVKYYVPNIRNSYISSTLYYGTNEFGNFTRSIGIDRPFFSTYAKWAAGIKVEHQFSNKLIFTSDSLFDLKKFKFNIQDYWVGNAIQLYKGNTENKRATNFISAIRFMHVNYLERPIEMTDPQNEFLDQNLYLASIGISTRKYIRDKYIYKFGVTEDVPIGKVYNLTVGYQKTAYTKRMYLGAKFAFGNFYPWGYLSPTLEYGTFFHQSQVKQGILSFSIIYFTNLVEIKNWKFRQFIKPQFTIGINRAFIDSLTINDGYGLDGFNSPILAGTIRMVFTMQTQAYSPWNFLGFRFGPYFNCSLGMIGNADTGFKNSKLYAQIGLGVLIKNEYLVFNTFQISIAFYPIIPGIGNAIFKTNSFKTTDFGFKNFEIEKPETLVFQ